MPEFRILFNVFATSETYNRQVVVAEAATEKSLAAALALRILKQRETDEHWNRKKRLMTTGTVFW